MSTWGVGCFDSSNIETVVFENGISTIPNSACSYMSKLKQVTIPDSVTSIKESAFNGCIELASIYLPDAITSIANNAFANCPKLTIYCRKYSKTMIMSIENGVNCVSSNDKRLGNTNVLDETTSHYSITSSAKITASCSYAIKAEVAGKVKNTSVKIFIPNGARIIDGTLYLDKTLCTNYTEKDNYISIPVTAKSGKISFQLEISGDCKLQTYALLNYTLDGKTDYDIIDVINEDVDLISINADDVISTNKVKVSGIAPAEKEVEIYVNEEKTATLKANKGGSYSGEITISNAEEGISYNIKAVSTDNNGKEISAKKAVLYQENAPELTELTMTYNGKTYNLLSGKKQNITFILERYHGGFPFTFKAKYLNTDSIDSVYFTSSRNQIIKKLKANWNEKEQAYIANGYFDDVNHDYVPGKIGVQYIGKSSKKLSLDTIDEEFNEHMPDELKNAIHEVVQDTEKRKEVVITLEGGETVTYIYEKLNFEEFEKSYEASHSLTNKAGENVGSDQCGKQVGLDGDSVKFLSNIIKYGWGYITSGVKNEYYQVDEDIYGTTYWNYQENKNYVLKETLIYSQKKIVSNILTKSMGNTVGSPVSSSIFFAYDEGKEYIGYYGTAMEYNQAIAEINTSSIPESEKQARIAELQKMKDAARDAACIKMIGTYFKFAGGLMMAEFPPLGLALWVTGFVMANVYNNDIFDSLAIMVTSFFGTPLNWSIDPSGFVYAAVTSNRIEGATVTAYWIPYDENEAYWNNPDETKAVVWDSDEYSQYNPLTTDAMGNYAWDVPEGWWKVKVEKEGYETYTSKWLPVPPPQTDVNINLQNKTVPVLTDATSDGRSVTLTFSEYMDPDTLGDITIKDKRSNSVTYTLSYSTEEASHTGKVYAKEFTLTFDESYQPSANYYNVEVKNAKSYAGIDCSATKQIGKMTMLTGDVNGNGSVNGADAGLLSRYTSGWKGYESKIKNMDAADINGDGTVNGADSGILARYTSGWKQYARYFE